VQAAASDSEMATLADAELVGHYGLRLRWQDGHDTGIFEFRLLRQLGEEQAAGTDPGGPKAANHA